MAERTLRLVFTHMDGDNKRVNFNVLRADDTKSGSVIRAAMDVIVAQKDIFNLEIGNRHSAFFITPQQLDEVNLS